MKNVNQEISSSVPIRHMQFEFDESKAAKYCWDNNAWGSAFILTFSALIPAGERLVIDAVRDFRDQIDDADLKARITGLIGQEAMHSKIHADFNSMYDLKGLPVNELVALSEKIYLEYLGPNVPKKTRLAFACAIEHVTAIMAEQIFVHNPDRIELLDEGAREFILWHLLEELEHKSVAYDLYQKVDGRYLHRIFAFMLIWSISVPLGLYGVQKFLNVPSFSQGKKRNRAGAMYHLKFFLSFSNNFASYFRKDFHPDNLDASQVLSEWREALFGEKGHLTNLVSKTINPKSKRVSPPLSLAS